MTESQLLELMKWVDMTFGFQKEAERSLEANPETLDLQKIKSLAEMGWTRLSLGVQSFQAPLLKRLERLATAEKIESVLDSIASEFTNFSLDLMIGLPDQDLKSLEKDLQSLMKFHPPHVSIYVLGLSEDHKWKRSSKMSSCLPSDEETAGFFRFCHEFLSSEAYDHYEVSNFSKKGFRSRHNENYWNPKSSYWGLGPGAHGYLILPDSKIRYEMIRGSEEWLAAASPLSWFESLSAQQQELEEMYLSLRSGRGLDASAFDQERLSHLEAEGLIEQNNSRFQMRCSEWVLLDSVVNALLKDL